MKNITPIEEIKSRIKIESLIAESLTVVGHGRTLTTREHDSLKIFTQNGTWHQFSSAEGGDIFDWYQRANKCDFRTALEELAQKAGVELRQLSETERQAVAAERSEKRTGAEILHIAATYYEEQLWANPQAVLYCASRGWNEETMRRERIGFSPVVGAEDSSSDNKALSVEPLASRLRDAGVLDHPLSKAVLSVPGGMLVYVHQERGLVKYLSGRSIEGKRHYNLPEEFSGGKQVYENTPVEVKRGVRVLVEGQADAISLGQLGLEAVALCGADGSVKDISHVAFDNDKTGRAKAMHVALGIDPLCRVVTWTTPLRSAQEGANHVQVKDANDILKSDATVDDVVKMLEDSPTALESLAMVVAKTKDEGRKDLLNKFFSIYSGLDEMVQADVMDDLAKHLCGGKISQFKRLLKAYEEENQKDAEDKPAAGRCEYSSGGACAGLVWEQCITWAEDGRGTTVFAVRLPNGEIRYQQSVDAAGMTYIPYPSDLGLLRARRVILFPERAEEYGSEQQLNKEIRAFIHDYLDVDPFYEKLASYYVMFTWLYDLFENLPYLRALGDYGTGKTRFIQTIGVMCYRPMLVSGASTTSPIFNIIDMFNGTLVIDEADFSNSDTDNEIIKILNIGYYKGGVVLRAEKDPNSETYMPNARDVFGPKILATRKLFTDRATESRCLTKRMSTARPRPGIAYTLGTDFWSRSQAIRNKLLMYRLRTHKPMEINHALADNSIEPRLNQVTLPLLTLIEDPEMRQEIWSFVKAYNEVLISDRRMTFPAMVVQALANIQAHPQKTLMGDVRDFSMKAIAGKVSAMAGEFDPDLKVNGSKISKCLNEDLGLVKRNKDPKNRRDVLIFSEDELNALMNRFGIEAMDIDE